MTEPTHPSMLDATLSAHLEPLRAAWWRVLRLWRPMAGWTLLVWAAVATVLAPVSSALIGWSVLRGDRSVVGNADLVGWLSTPAGALWLLFAGGLALVGSVVRYAGLFHMVTDDIEDHRTSVRRTALELAPQLPALYRITVVIVAAGALLALPLIAGLAAIRAVFLGDYDINYYLALRPPELHRALAAAAVWSALWALVALGAAGRVVLVLPAYLDGHRPLRVALDRARERARGTRGRLLRLLALAVGAWLLARLAVDGAFFAASSAAVEWVAASSASLRPIVLAAALHAILSVVLDAIVGFLGFSFVATVLTRFYHQHTDLHGFGPGGVMGDLRARAQLPFRSALRLARHLRPRSLLPFAAFAALVAGSSFVASGLLLERVPDRRPVLVAAHRAGPPPAPENTLAALERAIAAGADYAEIDVQRSRDGVVVVIHDADLMRMAGDPRRVAETDYAELADVVQRPDDGSPAEERRIATLGEFLQRARARIGLMIELKYYGPDPKLAPAVVRDVRSHDMEDQVAIISLDLGGLRQTIQHAPELTTGYLDAATVGDPSGLPVDFLALSRVRATPRLMRAARARGTDVHVWTVNRPADMAELIQRGVDGLITDDPRRAVRVRDELAALPPAARLLLRVHADGE